MIPHLIRFENLLLATFSYIKSYVSGSTIVKGMPLTIGVELTNHCNLKCPECASGSGLMQRERGFMDIELYSKILEELSPYLFSINLYFQGEPMMHPQFFDFLRVINNSRTVVSTNGHFLDFDSSQRLVRSGLYKLIISMDGIDQESYSSYRKNGSFTAVLEGIRNVTEAKKRFNSALKIEIQFLVNRLNEHLVPEVKEIARRFNTKLRLKSMQVINREETGFWLPENILFRRYYMKNGEYVIKSSLPDRCARLWFNPVITWDGKVVPCCFDKDAEHVMGDINNETFRQIWGGQKYRIFRKSILSGRKKVEICRNCTSGLRGVMY
jgi:radical SAM protein with 4Fe4S-binding SPASM domain